MMKRLCILLLLLPTLTGSGLAGEVEWYPWNEGIVKALEEDKPVMVFIHATWCHLCQRMDSRVFTEDEVAAMLNKDFIPVKLDAESKGELILNGKKVSTGELLGQITGNQFRGIPAYLFIPADQKGKNVLLGGLKDPQEMKAILTEHK